MTETILLWLPRHFGLKSHGWNCANRSCIFVLFRFSNFLSGKIRKLTTPWRQNGGRYLLINKTEYRIQNEKNTEYIVWLVRLISNFTYLFEVHTKTNYMYEIIKYFKILNILFIYFKFKFKTKLNFWSKTKTVKVKSK